VLERAEHDTGLGARARLLGALAVALLLTGCDGPLAPKPTPM
jgi:hypothetical protein